MCRRWRLWTCGGLAVLMPLWAAADSIVTPDTQKAIEETTGRKRPRISPQINMTDVMMPKPAAEDENPEIYFSADELENNQETGVVTARGHVEIVRDNFTVKADKIMYNRPDDTIVAEGNVVLLDDTGDVVFADQAELTDRLSQGTMENIKILMADRTRIAARSFRRAENNKKIMTNAVYSPCDSCRNSSPLWQIKARKVEHNAEKKDVNYQNATLEIKGVPVLYTPFMSHPDPTVKRRSGFLFPRLISNQYLGAGIQPQYFWNISDQEDVLFNPIITSDKGVIAGAAYNRYFVRGDVNASGTFLRDPDSKEDRGNIFARGRYEINDFWVADTDVNYASDSAYLKDLSLPKKDDTWLTSRARMQGFDNRNYAALEAYYYKILSYDLRYANSPYVLPTFTYENISNLSKLGVYNKNSFSAASVYHKDQDNNSQRATWITSWNLPYTSRFGEKYKFVASLKSDLYYVDNYFYEDNPVYDGTTARVFPQAGVEWRLPFIRAGEESRQIIEPIVVAAFAPNQSNKAEKIPNEDSQDIELTDINILNLDRYSGYDRNDTGSRISYGLNWSSYGNAWGRTSALLAQSYEFSDDESFAQADGQEGHLTDYVGRVYASPNEYFDLNYRFKLDKDDYKITYNELSTSFGGNILRMYISYIYFQSNETSSVANADRKELFTSLQTKLTKNWSLDLYNRQDLGEYEGSLEQGALLSYEDECTKVVFNVEKDNSNDPNYEGDFTIGATFYLKTLGGIGTK